VRSVFLHVEKVARNFGPNFMKISWFFSKKILHRANIFQWFSDPSRGSSHGHFFGHFLGSFWGYFSGDFSRKFSWNFLDDFWWYFFRGFFHEKYFSHARAKTLTSSNTGRLHFIEIIFLKIILSEQLHARERSVKRGPSVKPLYTL